MSRIGLRSVLMVAAIAVVSAGAIASVAAQTRYYAPRIPLQCKLKEDNLGQFGTIPLAPWVKNITASSIPVGTHVLIKYYVHPANGPAEEHAINYVVPIVLPVGSEIAMMDDVVITAAFNNTIAKGKGCTASYPGVVRNPTNQ